MEKIVVRILIVVLFGCLAWSAVMLSDAKAELERAMTQIGILQDTIVFHESRFDSMQTQYRARLEEWNKKDIDSDLPQALWPFEVGTYITSPYGRRKDPFQEGGFSNIFLYGGRMYGDHTGLDISTKVYHAQILSPVSGRVVTHYVPPKRGTRWKGHEELGGMIEIVDENGWTWCLGHLSTTYVHEGDWIKAGDIIARMGGTGRATADHLHIETTMQNGERVNPLEVLKYDLISPAGKVIP